MGLAARAGVVITLHQFQQDAVAEIERHISEGRRRILLVCPTGGGKTVIASDLIRRVVAKYQRALFLAHRREIILQTSAKLIANDVRHGIIMGGVDPRPMEAVQVASIDTLHVRGVRSDAMDLPPADLVVFDEAHRARGRTREHLISLYPHAVLLGMTATPCRGDGRGLGIIFEVMVECPQVAELISGGFLVKSRVYAPIDPDLKGVKTQQGDYVVSQLAGRMNTEALVGDIVTHWHKYGETRPTVAFGVDVAHSVHIRDEFLRAGVRAEHLDGTTPIDEREAILAQLATGETKVVSNCMVLTEGWDCPPVGCCILARPTKQMGLFRQMIGRVLRPSDGKLDAIILDHSGAVWNHGLPEDYVAWTLDVDRRAENLAHKKRQAGEEPKLRECPKCHAIMVKPPCANCGWQPQPKAREIEFEDGELGLVLGGKSRGERMRPDQQLQFYRELRGFARERGMKDGWAFHKCKERGFTPPWSWRDYPLIEPSPATRSWAKSRLIAFAKAKQREGQHDQPRP
jgi:DNA repair protein RadD